MKPNNSAKKIIFLAFLLSLLFHVGSIVYIALFKNDERIVQASENQIKPELQQNINKQQQDEWVETKARAGNFGTPVYFSSFAEATADTAENKLEEAITSDKKQEQAPQEKQIKEVTEIQKPIEEKKEEIKIAEIKPATPKKIVQQKTLQPKTFSQTSKPITGPKPPLTLSQLTQGFLNHVKHEGNHAIQMLGKKSGTPSDEQIKYERYLQKLSWCLQNSFSIHNDRFPPSANMDDTVQVLLALNKDGSMKHCHVSKTSGNRDLDHFTLFIFNDASTSFPPVPQYLPHDPFIMNYIVMVNASENNRWKLYRQ